MKLLVVLSFIIVGTTVCSNAFPVDEENVAFVDEEDVSSADEQDVDVRYGIQSGNAQPHRRPNAPRPSAPSPGPGCRIEYQTKYEVKEVESVKQECRHWTENKCTTKYRPRNVCETKYRQQCRNWTDKKCDDVWRNECNTRTREECNEYTRPIQVPYVEDECTTVKQTKCEKHWEEPVRGKKVWVDNPATCQDFDVTDCQPVEKFRTEQEPYTKCDQVPYEHCDRVKDTNCYDVPRQDCQDVPYDDCRDIQEPWQDCQDYPRKDCRDVHSKVPTQVAVQVPVRVCNHGNGGEFDGSTSFLDRIDGSGDLNQEAEVFDDPTREQVDPGLVDTNFGSGPKKVLDDGDVGFVFGDR